MSRHIGIVACSAEGAALCYTTICQEGQNYREKNWHPEISMHTPPLSQYVRLLENDDWDGVANLMLQSVHKLEKCGADFIICPDNTIHRAFPMVVDDSSLPWLHIAEEVAKEAEKQDFRNLLILGTKYLMESRVYPDVLQTREIEFVFPDLKKRKILDKIIFEELVNGTFKASSRLYFEQVINEYGNKECDAVVLGCTEIPLLMQNAKSDLPMLDSTRILARSAIKRSLQVDDDM